MPVCLPCARQLPGVSELDSDVNATTGLSTPFYVRPGTEDPSMQSGPDAGLYQSEWIPVPD